MLEKIEDTKCPDCGAKMTGERRDQPHTNGSWNEHRTFGCGLELHFIPNFMSIKRAQPCSNAKEFIKQKNVDKDFIQKLKNTINKNIKISPKLKEDLLSDCRFRGWKRYEN